MPHESDPDRGGRTAALARAGLAPAGRGYEVELRRDRRGGTFARCDERYDAAVVDLGLPGIDGMEVVHGLRGWTSIPIIVLSARDQGAQKIMALDAGADDYVTKPFNMGEFLGPPASCSPASQADGRGAADRRDARLPHRSLDEESDRTWRGREIKLTPTQWHLVEILVRNPDRLVSQRQLLEEGGVRPTPARPITSDSSWRSCGRKFEPDRAHPRYFLTEPGMGVRFVAAECEPGGP